VFVQELFGGADLSHRLPVRVVTQFAWHSLFIRHLLRRPEAEEVMSFTPEFTIINQPSFKADPASAMAAAPKRDRGQPCPTSWC
jgi:phosphoenolpyruvate carboxykinase (ATP)